MACRKRIFCRTFEGHGQKGFTILESLLAIGVLVTVFSQIVGVQAASLAVAKNTQANIQATWALRSLSAQVEYIADIRGVKGLPPDSSAPNPVRLNGSDEDPMRFAYKNRPTLIKASKFLMATMRLGQGVTGGADDAGGDEKFKAFGEMLDSQLPDDIYHSISLTALWSDGSQEKSMDLGMLMIDRKAVHIGIPGLTK